MNLSPSTFLAQPWESILGSSEAETIARNIMVIRKRLGDEWPLTWAQYRAERIKDGATQAAASMERAWFDEAIKLTPDAIGAISFSPTWAEAARKALKS